MIENCVEMQTESGKLGLDRIKRGREGAEGYGPLKPPVSIRGINQITLIFSIKKMLNYFTIISKAQ